MSVSDLAQGALLVVCGGFAAGVVLLESQARAGAALVCALMALAGALGATGAGLLGAGMLLLGGGAMGALLLTTVLLLNLDDDETGPRTYSVRATISLGLVLFATAAALGLVREAGPADGLVPSVGVQTALFEEQLALLALAGVALGISLISVVLIARRRA